MAEFLSTMKGKIVLITGATRGIGRAGAIRMAARGAILALVGRDWQRLLETAEVCRQAGATRVQIFMADLSLRQAVRELAKQLKKSLPRLDVLWNNAGGYFTERHMTNEGRERTWAMNHLAYFDLTQALFPLLLKSQDPRVICTASEAHRWGRVRWDNLQGERRWNGWRAYCQTKLANLLYVAEQGRRLGKQKSEYVPFIPG